MNEYPRLTIEIKNTQPVELADITNSLLSFAEEYKRYLTLHPAITTPEETKLYIKEIKAGSIFIDLVALTSFALPYIEHANTVVVFTFYVKTVYDYLLGRDNKRPDIQKTDLENLSTFLEPIAKDHASQLNCHTINGDVNITNVTINLNSTEANAIQNKAKREIELLQEPSLGIKEKELLYLYQARNDPKSKVGDKSIIETISPSPVKTTFINDALKSKMLHGTENPLKSAYIVDVEVGTIGGKPHLYTVLNVHDHIDKPPENEDQLLPSLNHA